MPAITRHRPFAALAGALLALGALIAPASASEDAELNIIGFSEDGTLFVFEEFGLQAGSGLPFSNLYVVDLPSDRWVRGTPFREMPREGEFDERDAFAALEVTRARTAEAAAPLLARHAVRVPGAVVFARGLGDHARQGTVSTIRRPFSDQPLSTRAFDEFDLRLEAFEAPSPLDYCFEPTRGYRLTLEHPAAAPVVLHEDSRVPRSRGCAREYRLSHFIVPGVRCAPERCPDGPLGVALISVFAQGFEGLGRSFIAAPVPLRDPRR